MLIVNEPWEQYAKWNKPVTKGQVLYDSTQMRYRVVKFIQTESKIVFARGWGERGTGSYCLTGTVLQFYTVKNFVNMHGGNGCRTIWMYLIPQNCIGKNG